MNFSLNLAINIETIVGDHQIDWISHLTALLMGVLLLFATSDFTVMPATVQRYKYILRRLATIFAIAATFILLVISLTRLRIHGIGRELWESGAC